MSLVDISELAAILGSDVDVPGLGDGIEIAELIISALIGGPIAQRTLTGIKVMPRRRRFWLELPDGPLTELTSVSIGGVTQTLSNYDASWWAVFGPATDPSFWPWDTVTLGYKTGWTSLTLPAPIRRAVLETAAARRTETGRSGILSERIGDYAVTYTAEEAAAVLPGTAVLLVQPYRRPPV